MNWATRRQAPAVVHQLLPAPSNSIDLTQPDIFLPAPHCALSQCNYAQETIRAHRAQCESVQGREAWQHSMANSGLLGAF